MLDPTTNELVTFLASRNVMDGILCEPRLYAQLFDFSVPNQVSPLASDDAVFRNGEQYPVRITHLVAAIRDTGTPATSDPRFVQRFGVRLRAHDTYYMNDEFCLLPLFHNTVVAASDVVSRALSSWRFSKPVYMGARDGFEVKLALEYAVTQGEGTIRVWVTFHGVGALSRRPKQMTGFKDFVVADGVAIRAIPIESFRNDGTEPLEVTEVTIHVQAADGLAGADPVGNIRRVKVSVRQSGNGTNQKWTTAPDAEPGNLVPASLWGMTTGRSIVHELPNAEDGYPGWLWYPNEGLTVEVMPNPGVALPVYVGLCGHIVVK